MCACVCVAGWFSFYFALVIVLATHTICPFLHFPHDHTQPRLTPSVTIFASTIYAYFSYSFAPNFVNFSIGRFFLIYTRVCVSHRCPMVYVCVWAASFFVFVVLCVPMLLHQYALGFVYFHFKWKNCRKCFVFAFIAITASIARFISYRRHSHSFIYAMHIHLYPRWILAAVQYNRHRCMCILHGPFRKVADIFEAKSKMKYVTVCFQRLLSIVYNIYIKYDQWPCRR